MKGEIKYILIILIFAGCLPRKVLVNHSNLIETYYFDRKISSQKNNRKSTLAERRKLLKMQIEYGFGFILEDADRLFAEDYRKGKDRSQIAYSLFKDAISLGTINLTENYPEFGLWLMQDNYKIQFKRDDIFDLYWLGAAYGGLIRASRGNPFDIIQLPKVGKLFNAALDLNPDWNNGAIYSAMISYTASRSDLSDNDLLDLVTKYFDLAVSTSDSIDASPFVSYAENIDKKFQNKSEFINKLEYVLGLNVNQNKSLRLGNIIAQERAKWLLTKTDEYFFE